MKIFRHTLAKDDFVTIITNLIPVYGVWSLGWNTKDVFIVYAMETFLIGILTLIKIGITAFTLKQYKYTQQANGNPSNIPGTFLMLFFLVNYGMLAAIQTSIFQQTLLHHEPACFISFSIGHHRLQNTLQ